MKTTNFLSSFRLTFLLVGQLMLCSPAWAESQFLTVNNPRPVAAALERLETLYLLPITYEDPLLVHDWEMTFDQGGRYIAKAESLSFACEAPPANAPLEVRKALAAEAIAGILQSHTTAHGAKMFTVMETDTGFHIVPTQFVNRLKQPEKLYPLLDTPVTIAPKERTVGEFLAELFKQLSAKTGQIIVPGTGAPMSWPIRTSMGASNESARSVLDRLFKNAPVGYASAPDAQGRMHDIPSSLSWRLLDDPNPKWGYALNFHTVAPEGKFASYIGPPAK